MDNVNNDVIVEKNNENWINFFRIKINDIYLENYNKEKDFLSFYYILDGYLIIIFKNQDFWLFSILENKWISDLNNNTFFNFIFFLENNPFIILTNVKWNEMVYSTIVKDFVEWKPFEWEIEYEFKKVSLSHISWKTKIEKFNNSIFYI